jgi:hypothetical protein
MVKTEPTQTPMHTTIIQIVTKAGIHEAHIFDAKTKAASISSARRAARKWWTLEGPFADFVRVQQFDVCDGLTCIELHPRVGHY